MYRKRLNILRKRLWHQVNIIHVNVITKVVQMYFMCTYNLFIYFESILLKQGLLIGLLLLRTSTQYYL